MNAAKALSRSALPLAAAAVCLLWWLNVGPTSAHVQLVEVRQIYDKPARLNGHPWKYEKADLPSARIAHPVLADRPWWIEPAERWEEALASLPDSERARYGSIEGMAAWLADARARTKARLAPVMAMPVEDLLRLVPPQSPIGSRRNYCPACNEGRLAWPGPAEWDRVRCDACGELFPNERFPADKSVTLRTPTGVTHTFGYHQDARGFNHFFKEITYEPKRQAALAYLNMLAGAYHLTREDEYARRAALLLDRFGEAFVDWIIASQDHPLCYVESSRGLHSDAIEGSMRSGRWGGSVARECASSYELAYDLIHESVELDRLSEERGYDLRERIERNLFYENIAVYYSGGYPLGTFSAEDAVSILGIARRARVLNDPAIIHQCRKWVDQVVNSRYHHDGLAIGMDGMFAPGFGGQTGPLNAVSEIIRTLLGWSDPEGFKPPFPEAGPIRDLTAETHFPVTLKARTARDGLVYPDGRELPALIENSPWPSDRRPAGGRLMSGWGAAVLQHGSLQSAMRYGGDYGLHHPDGLSFTLHAFGRELLSSVGYCDSGLEAPWVLHTASHNTVVVDRTSQDRFNYGWIPLSGTMSQGNTTEGNLDFYAKADGVSAVAVSKERAYAETTEAYKRTQVMISADPSRPYMLDVFRVKGGSIHDYLLHGSCDRPMSLSASADGLSDDELGLLDGRPRMSRYPRGWPSFWRETYALFTGVRSARTSGAFAASFLFDEMPGYGLAAHFLMDREAQLFLARTPSVRRLSRHHDAALQADFTRPTLAVRRRGEAGLKSQFVALLEPLSPQHGRLKAERLEIAEGPPDAVAVRVRDGSRLDTIILSGGEPATVITSDGYSLNGLMGVVTERPDGGSAGWLLGGSSLSWEGGSVEQASGRHEGALTGSVRRATGGRADALVTRTPLPEGEELAGSWIIVSMIPIDLSKSASKWPLVTAHRIARVERRDRDYLVHTDSDHGIALDYDTWNRAYALTFRAYEAPTFVIWRQAASGPLAGPVAAAPPAAEEALEPVEADGLVEGLDYRYWETVAGELSAPWDRRPLAEGVAAGPGEAAPARDNDFAVEYAGYIEIPKEGRYDFTLTSEGFASLEIGGRLVAMRELVRREPVGETASLSLSAGVYPVRIRHASGGEPDEGVRRRGFALDVAGAPGGVRYMRPWRFVRIEPSGGALARGTIVSMECELPHAEIRYTLDGSEPARDSALYVRPFRLRRPYTIRALAFHAGRPGEAAEAVFHAANEPPAEPPPLRAVHVKGLLNGILYRYYEGDWTEPPDLDALADVGGGVVHSFALPRARPAPFAVRFEGVLRAVKAGEHRFHLGSRDEARLFVGGREVCSSRGWLGGSGSVRLDAGYHEFRLDYIKTDRQHGRGIAWVDFEGPGLPRTALAGAEIKRPPVMLGASLPPGPIDAAAELRISAEGEAAKIRYTLDNSDPTARSEPHDKPLALDAAPGSGPRIVKARAFLGDKAGPLHEFEYVPPIPAPDVLLRDLEPTSQRSSDPAFGRFYDWRGFEATVGGEKIAGSMRIQPYTEATFALDPSWARFVAEATLDDFSRGKSASAIFEVYIDDRLARRSPKILYGQTWRADIAIPPGAREIRVVTDNEDPGRRALSLYQWLVDNSASRAAWIVAGFVKTAD